MMYLVIYDNEPMAFFFHELDALQHVRQFPEDQWDRYDIINVDDNRSCLMISLANDIVTNFRFEKVTGES